MGIYRTALPQLKEKIFFTDGGLETTLIFHDGIDLPHFAAFDLLNHEHGPERLKSYFQRYAEMAVAANCGFVLETPTWRASSDWGEKFGYDREALTQTNQQSIAMLAEIREELATADCPMVISGCIGPRGDGYRADDQMSIAEASRYHQHQISAFAATTADMVSAFTMTYPEEAIGITLAATQLGLPVVISFTTETDGCLPSGQTLREAIELVDAATDKGPAYYMINCAHPDHFAQVLTAGEEWTKRIRGIRANASRMSHAELDEAEVLDDGDPREWGQLYRQFREEFPQLTVLGGCCGTDHRHIEHVRAACCH
jgi:S-methylmethionine-dependent homocysteine/selenocysteine methylase